MQKTIITVKLLENDRIKSLKSVILPAENPDGFCGSVNINIAKGRLVNVERSIEKLKIIKDDFETKLINRNIK